MRSSGDETVMKLRGKSQPIRSSPCVACGNPPVPVSKKEILNIIGKCYWFYVALFCFLYSNNSQSIETWLKMVLFGKEYLAVGHLVKHFDTFPLVFQNLSDSTLLVAKSC